MSNTADPSFREVKERQGGPQIATADLFRLDNRTVVVTGAAGLLGLETAKTILEAGGDVVGLDVAPAPAGKTWSDLEKIAERYGGVINYFRVDVTNPQNVTDSFGKFAPSFRHPIRGLVACAGVQITTLRTSFPLRDFDV